jgi:hypothetical protein
MQNPTNNKFALAATWVMLSTLGGALACFAVAKYAYLVITAFTALLSWNLLISQRSRKIFVYCLILSIIIGAVCRLAFSNPDDSISGMGILLLMLPTMAINSFMVLRIYYIEAGTSESA